MWWNVCTALHSKFPAESASERIFKYWLRFDKVTAKSLVASFFGTQCSHKRVRLNVLSNLRWFVSFKHLVNWKTIATQLSRCLIWRESVSMATMTSAAVAAVLCVQMSWLAIANRNHQLVFHLNSHADANKLRMRMSSSCCCWIYRRCLCVLFIIMQL